MWNGNEEVNEDGQPVRLYQPIQYGGSNVHADDPTASYIGGPASTARQCPVCGTALVTLLQLHIPTTERSLRIEACNSTSCFRSLFDTSKFHFGGNGVVACERLSAKEAVTIKTPDATMKDEESKATKPVDDWGVSGDDDGMGLDDLEAKLAAMETSAPKGPAKKVASSPRPPKNDGPQAVLPIIALHSMQEPPARTTSDDPRDVGLHGTSNQKIEEMLARYLEEEEDQDIIQMLKGSTSGAGGQELDQDLTEEEMTFLRFSDRIKRAPRQVLRYACGGEPLWSLPLPAKSGKKRRESTNGQDEPSEEIPQCGCGAPRRFECQILPSVLHVLNVDKYANKTKTDAAQLNEWYSTGGMDFGSIAVYTCFNPETCTSSEEFVVIQDTVEEQPTMPAAGLRDAGDVVVDKNTKFDRDEDDVMQDD